MDQFVFTVLAGIGLLSFVAAILVIVGGIGRLAGRRTPVDRAADITASAISRSVFPFSLRGGGVEIPPRPDQIGKGRRSEQTVSQV